MYMWKFSQLQAVYFLFVKMQARALQDVLRSAPCNTYCFLTNAVSSLLSDMQAQAEGLMAQVFLFRDRRC